MCHSLGRIEYIILLIIFVVVVCLHGGESYAFARSIRGELPRRILTHPLKAGDCQPPKKPPRPPTIHFSSSQLQDDETYSSSRLTAVTSLINSFRTNLLSTFQNTFLSRLWIRLSPWSLHQALIEMSHSQCWSLKLKTILISGNVTWEKYNLELLELETN